MGACWPGINIVPQVINVAVRGAQALPIGFNVNPAVILVNAQGAQAWPRCGSATLHPATLPFPGVDGQGMLLRPPCSNQL